MHKKIDINELDIPNDDVEAWERYPKYHWVYDVSRLLDVQNIKWSPFKTNSLKTKWLNMNLESKTPIDYSQSYIFVNTPKGNQINTEVYIAKGEIKFLRHIDLMQKEIEGIIGEIELRINAFVMLHFQKFTGVISILSIGADIYGISLRPHSELAIDTNAEVIKFTKRIYKKNELEII